MLDGMRHRRLSSYLLLGSYVLLQKEQRMTVCLAKIKKPNVTGLCVTPGLRSSRWFRDAVLQL